jgi:hypothetical protein
MDGDGAYLGMTPCGYEGLWSSTCALSFAQGTVQRVSQYSFGFRFYPKAHWLFMICSAFQSISTQTTDSVSVSGIPYLHYGLKNEPMLLGMFAVLPYTTRFCLLDPSANPATFFPLQLHRCRQWSCWMASVSAGGGQLCWPRWPCNRDEDRWRSTRGSESTSITSDECSLWLEEWL